MIRLRAVGTVTENIKIVGKHLGQKRPFGITATRYRRLPPTAKPDLAVPLLCSEHLLLSQFINSLHICLTQDLEHALSILAVMAALADHLLDLGIGHLTANELMDIDRHTY